MKRAVFLKKTGFTLVELMVVVIIIGVLASIAIPRYAKSIEQSKADDAVAFVRMIGNTNRMFQVDNNFYAAGLLGATCACVPNANACQLIGCRYLAAQNWGGKPYQFYADALGGANCPANSVACAKRRTGASPGTDTPPYNGWGYYMDANGKTLCIGSAAHPPGGQAGVDGCT